MRALVRLLQKNLKTPFYCGIVFLISVSCVHGFGKKPRTPPRIDRCQGSIDFSALFCLSANGADIYLIPFDDERMNQMVAHEVSDYKLLMDFCISPDETVIPK